MTYCTKCGKPTNNGIMCEDCIISNSPWLLAMKNKEDDLVEQIEQLKSENAALRNRLSRAVEFPCKLGDKLYYVNEYLDIPKINEYTVTAFTILPECIKIYVGTGDYFLLDDNVCFTPEAAEARLEELKREK